MLYRIAAQHQIAWLLLLLLLVVVVQVTCG
jgi:hypothetical protein